MSSTAAAGSCARAAGCWSTSMSARHVSNGHANRSGSRISSWPPYPAPLRRDVTSGGLKAAIHRPTPAEMIARDPSEAVRSGEIEQALRDRFDVKARVELGRDREPPGLPAHRRKFRSGGPHSQRSRRAADRRREPLDFRGHAAERLQDVSARVTPRQLLYADVPELHERRNAAVATVRRSPAAVLQFDGFSCSATL